MNHAGTATYTPQAFDFSQVGDQITESIIFKTTATFTKADSTNGQRLVQLGFLTTTSGGFNNNANQTGGGVPYPAFTSVRVSTVGDASGTPTRPVTLEGQQKPVGDSTTDADTLNVTSNFSIEGGEYYLLTMSATQDGDGAYSMTGSLQDMGANGATPGATVQSYVATGATGLSDIATTVYPGFRTTGLAGDVNLDDFTVTGVFAPEPGVIGLLGMGGIGLLAHRRRPN